MITKHEINKNIRINIIVLIHNLSDSPTIEDREGGFPLWSSSPVAKVAGRMGLGGGGLLRLLHREGDGIIMGYIRCHGVCMLPWEIHCQGIHMLQGTYVAMVLPRDTCSQ